MSWFGGDKDSSKEDPNMTLMARAEKFQKDLDVMLTDVTRMSLPLQKESFLCCAGCFDLDTSNLENITDCVKRCQDKPEKFGTNVQNELNQLQNILLNCQQKCLEDFSSQSKAQEMERCAIKCYDKNQKLLGDIKSRLKSFYDSL
ncbi:hypothetical protein BEWA_024160 [Theileria equi strain WA]|uniref:Uncharacterized protein n=1 Tax=Theileria equi strain WA TaxID=1537102 RepID=L0AVD0_THEEQ|nr:hypothetical protein BEWA_024160 [Theileria equi strain WA]AFZ79567.1 hypothetical protein BEWA_024160 [Theileria equi strain WA]|eukprot:XP_004829233.1 hypothetical protein BEWA_024160 [Theileria equi strain WA]